MCALLRKRQEHSQPRYCVEIRCNEHLLDMFCQRKIARQRSGCYICYLYCFFQSVLYILQHRLAHTQSPVKMYAKSVPGCHAVEAASSVHQITDRDYVLATLSPACYLNRHHYITPHSIPQSPSAPLLPEVLLHFRFPHRLVLLVHEPDGDIIEPLGVLSLDEGSHRPHRPSTQQIQIRYPWGIHEIGLGEHAPPSRRHKRDPRA